MLPTQERARALAAPARDRADYPTALKPSYMRAIALDPGRARDRCVLGGWPREECVAYVYVYFMVVSKMRFNKPIFE